MALLEPLLASTLAVSAGILLVLALRRPLRKAFGARVAYGAWALVPALVLAVLLPAAELASPGMPVLVLPGAWAAAAPAQHAGFDPRWPWAAAWLAGLLASAAWMGAPQARFRRSLGHLVPGAGNLRVAEREVGGLPATLGWLAPRVVVPPSFEQRYDALQRELILAHEQAHVRRGDVQANAVAAALRCLFWFNPLLHLAAPRFRQDQELACDATVLDAHPRARRRYGEALLQAQLAAQATPLGCHFGFGHPLRERFAMLREQLPSAPRRRVGAVIVTVLAMGLGLSAWAARPQVIDGPQSQAVERAVTPAPRYPADALAQAREGKVVLRVDVAADGTVEHAVVERAEPAGVFDQVALEAVKRWKFKPGTKDGKPVGGQVRVPIFFDLGAQAAE